MWKDLLRTFKQIPRGHQNDELRFDWLKDVLKVKLNEKEYSDFFKFLTEIVKIHPETLEIVIERIQLEWQNESTSVVMSSVPLFKSTVSFLGRLKKSVRRQEFKGKISRLWPIIFNFPAEDRLKLHLVREYRRELPFGWLYEFILKDEFFYNENLNVEVLDGGAMAVVDILMELLDKSRGDEELMDELRASGLLEKIGSLWRSPALPKLVKLLTMASTIAVNSIFDSLPCLMDSLIELEMDVWSVRLVDSVLRKYSKRQYVLSQSRAELNSISRQVIKIASKSISDHDSGSNNYIDKSVCGLVKSVLERWEGMACSVESEVEFCEKVVDFLECSYKTCDDSIFDLLSVFAKDFIEPLIPQITLFFRNALKLAARSNDNSTCNSTCNNSVCNSAYNSLNIFTKILVNDGGTDRAFPLLFKEYPSLIEDVHKILAVNNETTRLLWLLNLAESPRTKKVLVDFLVDSEQINEMESNDFWISFMGRLAHGNLSFDKWSKGQLLEQFIPRAMRLTTEFVFDDYFFSLLKHVIEKLVNTEVITDDSSINAHDILFLLITCKRNFEMFSWLTETINCKEIILSNLKDFYLESEEIAKKVYEIVKNDLFTMDEILDSLFQSKDKEKLETAASQWNLLIESGKITVEDIDTGTKAFYTEDYGNYLEKLFDGIQRTSKIQLIKESDDPIEMFLEYYKFGQLRSMKILQEDLLSRFKCSELLLRIPLVVLKATGPDFGGIILDSLIRNGWDQEDLEIVLSSACNEYNFDLLKMYYKNRLNKCRLNK